MPRSESTHIIIDGGHRDAISSCYFRASAPNVLTANLLHDRICNFCAVVIITPKNVCPWATAAVAPFSYAIKSVLLRCACPQMCRVDTWRVITGMANQQTWRNSPLCQRVSKAMCEYCFALIRKMSISLLGMTTLPQPAFACFVNLAPEYCFFHRIPQ